MVSLSGGLLAAGLALAVLMLAAVIGPFHVFDRGDDSPTATIGLWVPASAFAVPAPERARRLRAWRTATGRQRDVRALRELDADAARVVALTDGRALRPDEVRALRAFVESGGGAILTGAVGVRDGDGGWRGWGLMEELLGARPIPVDRESSRSLVANARGPLTAALATTARVPLHAEPGAPALETPAAELRWQGGGAASGASRRLSWRRGRVVWLGAGPERSDENTAEQLFVGDDMTRLLDAAIAWVAREPFVEVLPWPQRAALGALIVWGDEAPEVQPAALAGASSAAERRRVLDEQIARAALGARLFRLELPEGFGSQAERRLLLEHSTRRLHQEDAWFAARGEIARWRRLQTGVVASIRRVGPRRHLIAVTNRNDERVEGAALRVHLNDDVREARLGRTTLQQQEPRFSHDRAAGRLDLALPPLDPGATQSFTLDLERLRDEASGV